MGLDADTIWNAEGNNVLQGLEMSTRNIVSLENFILIRVLKHLVPELWNGALTYSARRRFPADH